MVGIVIVSHSYRIAEGVAELAREMGGPDVRLETAGGLNMPDHPIGTDAVMVMEAIERAWSDDGVLVLMDLGSAVLSAEMALDLMPEERRSKVLLCEAPIVEGAVVAAVTAKLNAPLDRVAREARGGLAGKIAHLGDAGPEEQPVASTAPDGAGASIRVTVTAAHGLHARPAARLVQTASSFDARVTVRDLTNGRGPADAASLNAVAMLSATMGHEIEVAAVGRRRTRRWPRSAHSPNATSTIVRSRRRRSVRRRRRHCRTAPGSCGVTPYHPGSRSGLPGGSGRPICRSPREPPAPTPRSPP